ncbi:MAG: NADH-dependent [FeFe] hydrogenase, group A6 [Clostridia bacterium]|nr:NADH-dependent [FeFe] hydrogenase, group A6 [Clostridia bacterium]
MSNMINVKIDNVPVTVESGTTILEAAKQAGIKIPTLCFLKEINEIGACRVCVCEVKGARSLVASCVYPLDREGTEVFTNTPKVLQSRKTTVELLLSNHDQNCLGCVRNQNCELQKLSLELGCDNKKYAGEKTEYPQDLSTPYLIRDNSKCILCRRCVAACEKYQSVSVIGANARGFDTHIGTAFEKDLGDVPCVGCGQCIAVCPTGALRERDEIDDVLADIANPDKYVIVGTAPATRVGIGEEFGYPIGTNTEGKMVAALRRCGFNNVFDVDFTADLTIMEEGYEFLDRLNNGGKLPMLTSCSPAWIKFVEHYYPQLIDNLSTCKSPQQMFGALCKTYYAEKIGVPAEKISVVSIMPCTAKKFEKGRPYQNASGYPDIDHVLTTREMARMFKRKGIIYNELPDEQYDAPLGIGSGAGLLFGATGGVMEAALRTLAEVLEGKELTKLDFTEVRGIEGIKEAKYTLAGIEVKVAVASGLANARKLMDLIVAGKADYHFIEIMSCPGGCVNGGGQPIHDAYTRNNVNIRELRAKALYSTDVQMKLRKSHENPYIKEIYDNYLGKPNSHKAHELLHTKYVKRGI